MFHRIKQTHKEWAGNSYEMGRQDTIQEISQEQQPSAVEITGGDLSLDESDGRINGLDSVGTDEDDLNSIGSLSTVEDAMEDDPLFMPYNDVPVSLPQKPSFRIVQKKPPLDVNKYMAAREMTPTQERWNALTIVPNPIFCLYYILAGLWISQDLKNQVRDVEIIDDSRCIQSEWFPGLAAIPPGAVLAVLIGISLHAPFSYLYHWKYAHSLPPGLPRTTHWSRRMDHAMIHVASTFLSYATSGSWDYLIVNALFNADCVYRQFKKKVRPRRNQIRVGLSIVAYTIPVLKRGETALFFKCWVILFLAGYFFVHYPVGGWSHSVFHVIIAFLPPYLMQVASTLPTSQEYMEVAAKCAILAEDVI